MGTGSPKDGEKRMNKDIQDMVIETVEGRQDFREKIIERLEPLIKKSIRKYYFGHMDYEDLLQEGRLRLLKEIDRFEPERGTIFIGLARKSLEFLYCELRRKKLPLCLLNVCLGGDDKREEIDFIEEAVNTEDLCLGNELRDLMKEAFAGLEPIHADMIADYFIRGKSLRQIAGERNIHYMTAVQRKRRALEELGKNLRHMGYGV